MTQIAVRNASLRRILLGRREEFRNDVRRRIRAGRADRVNEVRDDLEHSDAHTQGDMELALIQLKAETLTRIDEALTRLDAGKYGTCFECENGISERRLRALPFAVRCQECEERREQRQGQARELAQRRGAPPLFSNVSGS
jgi:DnaK suppressor protein